MTSLLIDDRYRAGEFFIYIGDPAERGHGTGTTATTMVLDWAFHVTALRCVYLEVLANNVAAIHAYEKAGFRTVGTRRRTGSWLGQPADEVIMDAIPRSTPDRDSSKPLCSATSHLRRRSDGQRTTRPTRGRPEY